MNECQATPHAEIGGRLKSHGPVMARGGGIREFYHCVRFDSSNTRSTP